MNFEIKDSGIGMTPEQINRVFEPFVQADDSVTRRFGGTGLGLAITKNIIELMGGELQVESALGVGSKFSFSLTFDLSDDVQNITPHVMPIGNHEKPNFKGEILICEDNTLNQQVICDHLQRVGLTTFVANDGLEGVVMVTKRIENGEQPFNLIFMDIHMPNMDGLEAAKRITALETGSPIVALTANIMSNDVELYKKSGMTDFIGKPFTTHELWNCLIKHMPLAKIKEIYKPSEQLKVLFVKNNRHICDDINNAIQSDDIKTAHRLAHTLKSNAGQFGEKPLQEAAAAMENMLAKNEKPFDDELLSKLKNELEPVINKFLPLLEREKNIVKVTESAKILTVLAKLEHLLNNRNPECINMLDEVRSVPDSDELSEFIEKLKFKQAMESLKQIKNKWNEAENG
jgi:CheY-like chemotaxis protein